MEGITRLLNKRMTLIILSMVLTDTLSGHF